ncbi:glycine betaine ABC transporter substrate-binding protein [Oceanobacillus polygoni]|uniref:Glycine betaine/proline transport system substrate-binding protein n=1 Tax=Oceanobacillus polygoni TaxID=1235259 RepID=A0A9X0YXF4_9BACI|nr:glycine betaine ABC transporter substrate-binding protein [Oceanobacillus polygoni]MBP2079761.1 glycine betaine/proline transport system substrate-binding protein [Oceanobacillus polygoni]
MKKAKHIGLIFGILTIFILAACGGSDDDNATDSNGETDYSEEVDYTIIGIEPGAGISVTTEAAIEEYDSLQGWSVELSSTAAMMTELRGAIENEEPIVITGWNPHWMFAEYPDMKYLDDPEGIYGGEETLNSLARIGLEEEKPEAYKLIDQFEWNVEDMEAIMYEAEETGKEVEEVAVQWVEDNQDRVAEWVEGVEDVDGVEIELASTPWDSERASSGVLKEVMEQKGFNVTVTELDVAIMFESIATGDADASLGAWLPITHKDFYEAHQDNIVDLGPNLNGAKIGLVVPEYMDIDSIEDLNPR